ncbi:hypothetical protein Ddye_029190 [Dipteronia dyeriana]|uniref:Transposase MuDR plant domain-containing protein n=1 Tax=Dipteronia dyeriana TaxID=168575 RepID=A0AAD9WLK3_9ROSI|nr:hypothetical protein Ddye_029190 [Dipteronia dyeriana]
MFVNHGYRHGSCLFYGSQLGMEIFKITVLYGTKVIDLGQYDADRISLITLVHALSEKFSGSNAVPEEQYTVWAHLPWSSDTSEVKTDNELINVFAEFGFRDEGEGIDGHEGDEGLQSYDGDGNESEKSLEFDDGVGIDGHEEVEGLQPNNGHEEGEGLQSSEVSDDVYFSDSDQETTQVRITKLMKSRPFQRLVEDEIKFSVGQTFDDKVVFRNIFRDYVIQKGVVLDRIKNDLIRQTYKYIALGCHWRAHAPCMIDKTTFILKTLVERHECHRVYNQKEVKVKWIASKFETLVKSNPTVSVKVIGDLLREKFNVAVDIKRLYRAKHRALIGLREDRINYFQYIRQYAYTLNQTKPTLEQQYTSPSKNHCRHFIGFIDGFRLFIRLDGRHLKGPCGGWLLSVVALDANNGLFPLAYPFKRHLTFMSDRQKGMITTLETHFSSANRRYWTRHIYTNFRLSYPGEKYERLFWKTNRSCNVFEFKIALNKKGYKEVPEEKGGMCNKEKGQGCFHHLLKPNLVDPNFNGRENLMSKVEEGGKGLLYANTMPCPSTTKGLARMKSNPPRILQGRKAG